MLTYVRFFCGMFDFVKDGAHHEKLLVSHLVRLKLGEGEKKKGAGASLRAGGDKQHRGNQKETEEEKFHLEILRLFYRNV